VRDRHLEAVHVRPGMAYVAGLDLRPGAINRMPDAAVMMEYRRVMISEFERGQQAYERGLALLMDWLTPKQRERLKEHGCFEVEGSDTRRRYRIRHGQVQNVDELDCDGNYVRGWCFAPAGNLVPGDVMLAQKIALECNERKTLRIANSFM
jgi:hypothetical protein